jgi:cob(I)alamin adenosyltransferase
MTAGLEARIDEIEALPGILDDWALPGATPAGAAFDVARTVARRAERVMVQLAARDTINPQALVYINRLSDLLFILARAANPPGGEVLWVPGGER